LAPTLGVVLGLAPKLRDAVGVCVPLGVVPADADPVGDLLAEAAPGSEGELATGFVVGVALAVVPAGGEDVGVDRPSE